MISFLYGNASGRNEIAAPDFGADRCFEFVRGEIEQPLHHEHAVLAPGAAIGRHDRQIGEDRREGAVIGRHHIGAEQRALAVDRNRQAIGIIGAGVVQEDVLDAEDAAVAVERDLGVVNLAALMRGRKEMLEPVLDPFHRTVEPHRDPRQRHLFRVEHHDLRPEAAADERRDHAHLPLAEAEHRGKAVANEHRRLRGVPDRHLVGAGVPLRHHAAGLDRRGNAVLVAKAAFEDQIGLRGGAAIIALGLADMGGDVGAEIVVNMRRCGVERLFDIDDRRQDVEIDLDIVERVLGDVAAFGDHDRQRLADVADLVLGQRHLGALIEDDSRDRRRRHQQRSGLPVGAEIVGGVDRHHAWAFQRRANVDAS